MRRFMMFLLLATISGLLSAGCVSAVNESSVSSAPAVNEAAASAIAENDAGELAGESQNYAVDDDFTNDDFTYDDDFTNGEVETLQISDPIEPFNRGMFWVNDKLYFYLFKPIARGFRVVPEPARESVSNFFSNIGTPVRFANSLLQLKFQDAGTELGRLVINSTLGIGGLFDPAKAWFDLDKKEEDFGQTLGNYGVGSGFYIVWPIFGPSNARDTVGMVGDFFMDPLHYVEMKPAERVGLTALDKENDLSLDKDTYESVKQEALDPYMYVRNAYEQYRDGKIKK
ncbi:MAG: phospholipid-binding lipoprotein MlaA [Desulfuromonadales bacterium]|jgi:phospholipid-binding lipoprotein MlaA|nr:phospholipid-binding lipoprotein MlaA [Desulfuromonadales bacterium]